MEAHLRDLRYFVAVAEEQSFTRAAARLHVSQPALSKQIRQLEHTLRAVLLRREPHGVALTSAGATLLPEARRLLAQWDGTASAVREADARERSQLRVGLQTSLGRDLYPAIASRFEALQPGWRLTLQQRDWTDASAGLLSRETDVAFLWLPAPDGLEHDGVEHSVLVTEERWVSMASHHRLAGKDVVDFADLLNEPFIALPPEAGALRDFWLAVDERQGHPMRIALETSGPEEVFEAVTAGAGVHLLAAGNAEIYDRPGVSCRPVRGLSPCHLGVAWRAGDQRPAVRAFIRACQDAVAR
jgi:DNA-binding transcriptional LysR family regulator